MIQLSQDYEPRFSGFHDLMKFRVREILLVSSLYDAFVLEEDGRLSERIFSEYLDLNLRFVPRITRVSTAEQGLTALASHPFDLVITMTRLADMDPAEFGRTVKERHPGKPVVLLTTEPLDQEETVGLQAEPGLDGIFYWTGDSKILLAVVKSVEDARNADRDAVQGVQVVLVVEDSPKYTSVFLPLIYTEIMSQTGRLISEGLNDFHRLLRMRARPKILTARSYDEAVATCERFSRNLLGVISDIRYRRAGRFDPRAGFHLARRLKREVPDLPILLQSSDPGNRAEAEGLSVGFLEKLSPNLLHELRGFILENFGFGDFVFRLPDGAEVARAATVEDFERLIMVVPSESLEYHARGNHISRWLRARTEFALADELRSKKVSDFETVDDIRVYVHGAFHRAIGSAQEGVIVDFGASHFDGERSFSRVGSGSLGGKGRGIAFVNNLLTKADLQDRLPDVQVLTPNTVVVSSEVFEEFMEANDLLPFALSGRSDQEIADRFRRAHLPKAVVRDLDQMLRQVRYPLAVRSSSLLEDSQLLPFAGLYRTYILPNRARSRKTRLAQLLDAVRLVYASVYYRSPQEYVTNTNYRIEEEKMAVVVQQLAGTAHGDAFYPVVSGVAQTHNYYPYSHLEPGDGIAHLALGLGKSIVEGERIWRFSPAFPEMNPPFGSAPELVKNTQSAFYALNLAYGDAPLTTDDACTLTRHDLTRAEKDGTLFFVGSTYSAQENAIRDTLSVDGPRVVTFANLLKFRLFPLAEVLTGLLDVGRLAFATHVEIEFALDLRGKDEPPAFHFLQIRPMITGRERAEVAVEALDPERTVVRSARAMGNGVFTDIHDLVYVDPDAFDLSKTRAIAREVDQVNGLFIEENRPYILMGFGRWGTSDPWLGIPTEWSQISRARVVVESNREGLAVEPSQGSHFFHNLVSLRMGYLHVRRQDEENGVDWAWLRDQPAHFATEHVRHVRFREPLVVKIDGKTSRGVVFKPGE